MANRPLISPFISINAGDMSGDIVGAPTIIQTLSMVSYSFSWAGSTPVGTVSVQVSNDYSLDATGQVKNAGTWNTIELQVGGTTVTSIPVSGNTGNGLIDIVQTAAYAIRPIYTKTSGTGSITAILNSKVA